MIKRDKLRKEKKGTYDQNDMRKCLYRPFTSQYIYFGYIPIDLKGKFQEIFPNPNSENRIIAVNGGQSPFNVLAANKVVDLHFNGDSLCLPLYRYTESGEHVENITDWSLGQFQKHYKDKAISKLDIFHYVYGVLHQPTYREKYKQNLKRESPRIPFYKGFRQWADWGKRLMELHVNYETVEPYPLEREEKTTTSTALCRLMARKEPGVIEIDTITTLRGVPPVAWEYRLGTYSALEWVLERYKEKKPKDPTITEMFNTYKFADYKESVIDLLGRVCMVSVKTMEIIRELSALD